MCKPPVEDFSSSSDDEPITESGSTTAEDDEFDEENNMTLRAKWTMDKAKTLDECIEKLQGFIEYIKQLKEEGWELTQPVDDDWGFIRRNSHVAST